MQDMHIQNGNILPHSIHKLSMFATSVQNVITWNTNISVILTFKTNTNKFAPQADRVALAPQDLAKARARIVTKERKDQVLVVVTLTVQIVTQANTLKPKPGLYVMIVMLDMFRTLAGIIVILVPKARKKKVQVSAKIVLLAK